MQTNTCNINDMKKAKLSLTLSLNSEKLEKNKKEVS
jgi:hypothetical protein